MQISNANAQRHYSLYCEKLKEKNLLRSLSKPSPDRIVADFSHNDYLTLSKEITIANNALSCSKDFGTGSSGSRLLSGNIELFAELENKIAQSKSSEDALILNSGFIGNVTVIASLLDKQVLGKAPLIFADKAIHASIHLGIKLAEGKQIRYNHLDLNHLENLLKEHQLSQSPKFIFSETIFSMDGDILDLKEMIFLAQKYNAFLYLDEAHDIGVYGESGYGLSAKYSNQIGITLGSFSKALGCFGGYVALSKDLKQYLINKCSGVIYSTASPPMVIGAVSAAWDALPTLDKARQNIQSNAKYLRDKLKSLGLDIGNSSSHIIPIILKDATKTLNLHGFLKQNGILTSAIRPPSVAQNSARLRLTVCKEHDQAQIDYLLELLKNYQYEQKL